MTSVAVKREPVDDGDERGAKRARVQPRPARSVHDMFELARWPEFASGGACRAAEAMRATYDSMCFEFGHDLVLEYIRFLAIKVAAQDYAGDLLSPSQHVDAVWHYHILHVDAYVAFCDAALGFPGSCRLHGSLPSREEGRHYRLLSHNPATAMHADRDDRYRYTLALYERRFGAPPPDEWWPAPPAAASLAYGDDGVFQVFVKKLTGRTLCVNVRADTTGHRLKQEVGRQTGLPLNQMRLIFAGRPLANRETLLERNIQRESTFHLVLRIGGC